MLWPVQILSIFSAVQLCSAVTYTYKYSSGQFSSSTYPKKVAPKTSLTNGDQFGEAVAIWGDRAVISATDLVAMEDGVVGEGGIVYLFYQKSDSREWYDSGLQFETPYGMDGYGKSLALWSSTIAVGAPLSGIVHVYTGSNYQVHSELTAHEAGENDYFGCSVAVVHGGSSHYGTGAVVVGAYGHSENKEHQHTGSAFVFAYNNYVWKQVANLQPAKVHQGGYFGFSVSAFGNFIAIGAPGSESAYVFSLIGTTHMCPHEGHRPEGCEEEHHHLRRGLQGHEGEGHEGEDHEREDREREERENQPQYYTEYKFREELEVVGAQGEELGFGSSVSIYNGTTLSVAIGSIYDYQSSSSNPTGAVYVISQIASSDAIASWHPTDYFPEHEHEPHRRSLQAGGEEHHNEQRYWPIKQAGYTADKLNMYWMLETTVFGTTNGEKFGAAVALEYGTVVVGTHPGTQGVGRVEIYSRGDASTKSVISPVYRGPLFMKKWDKVSDLTDTFGGVNDMFGSAVALYGTTVLVGSSLAGYSSSSNTIGTGAAYVYDSVLVTATLVAEAQQQDQVSTTVSAGPVVSDGLSGIMKSLTVLSFSFIVAVFSSVCGFVAYKFTQRKIDDGSLDPFYAMLGLTRAGATTKLSEMDSSVNSQHPMLGSSSTRSNTSSTSSGSFARSPMGVPPARSGPVSQPPGGGGGGYQHQHQPRPFVRAGPGASYGQHQRPPPPPPSPSPEVDQSSPYPRQGPPSGATGPYAQPSRGGGAPPGHRYAASNPPASRASSGMSGL